MLALEEAIEELRAVCEGSGGRRRLERRHKAQMKQSDTAHRQSLAATAKKQSSTGDAWKKAHGDLVSASQRTWQAKDAANKTYDRLRHKIDRGETRTADRKPGSWPVKSSKKAPVKKLKPNEKMVFGRVVKVA